MISGYLYLKILTEIVAFVLCRNFFFTSGLVDGNPNVSGFDDEKQITWECYSLRIAVQYFWTHLLQLKINLEFPGELYMIRHQSFLLLNSHKSCEALPPAGPEVLKLLVDKHWLRRLLLFMVNKSC